MHVRWSIPQLTVPILPISPSQTPPLASCIAHVHRGSGRRKPPEQAKAQPQEQKVHQLVGTAPAAPAAYSAAPLTRRIHRLPTSPSKGISRCPRRAACCARRSSKNLSRTVLSLPGHTNCPRCGGVFRASLIQRKTLPPTEVCLADQGGRARRRSAVLARSRSLSLIQRTHH